MNFKGSTDQSLLSVWQSMQRQVAADGAACGRYRFVGTNGRAYAERHELEIRKLRYTPIRWQ